MLGEPNGKLNGKLNGKFNLKITTLLDACIRVFFSRPFSRRECWTTRVVDHEESINMINTVVECQVGRWAKSL
jgi:hypothetical protein